LQQKSNKILGLHNNSQKMHLPRVFAIYQIWIGFDLGVITRTRMQEAQ
jgi:hypothetical protein